MERLNETRLACARWPPLHLLSLQFFLLRNGVVSHFFLFPPLRSTNSCIRMESTFGLVPPKKYERRRSPAYLPTLPSISQFGRSKCFASVHCLRSFSSEQPLKVNQIRRRRMERRTVLIRQLVTSMEFTNCCILVRASGYLNLSMSI